MMKPCEVRPALQRLFAVGLISSAALMTGAVPALAQTTDVSRPLCSMGFPPAAVANDAQLAASIAQTEADCKAAVAPAS